LFFPKPSRPCFVPVTLLGFTPAELFPCRSPVRLSTPAPLLTLPKWPAQRLPRQAVTDDWRSTRSASGVSPSGKAVRRAASVSSLTVADALLVFSSLQGSPTANDGLAFASPPLPSLIRVLVGPKAPLLASLDLRVLFLLPCGWSPEGDCRPSWVFFPFHSSCP
jgi:hypothetical protein